MWFIPHNTLVIRFTYCLYRSIPFFSSINFPSKISCNTCLHGIRCNLLTSDASITRKYTFMTSITTAIFALKIKCFLIAQQIGMAIENTKAVDIFAVIVSKNLNAQKATIM